MKTQIHLLSFLIALIFLNGCAIAPVATSFESARLVKPGKVQAAILYSSYSMNVEQYDYPTQNGTTTSDEDNTTFETLNNNYGVKIIFGGERTNIGIHYEQLQVPDGEIVLNYFSLEPKFRLSENKSAFSIPVVVYFSDSDVWEIQLTPTFLFTFSDDKYVELNLSPKAILFLSQAPMFSLSLGLGLSSDLSQWAIRPEVGYSVSTSPESYSGILHVGAGTSINFGK